MNREHPTGTERKSLTQECGWKGGDRGGLVERGKLDEITERAEKTLDRDRPSHGRHKAVNRRVASSNLARGAKFSFFFN